MSNGFPTIAPTGSPTVPLVPPPSSPSPIPFTDAQVDAFREQDRCLPIANVARMMKTSLPAHAKVSKEAKECVQECVSEFISFITSEGADKCLQEKRKTINGEDILSALRSLGFDNYEGVLTVYLAKLREYQMAFARSRQHIGGDELNEELSDGEDAIEGKRKWKRNGEGVEPKRLKDEEGIYTG